MDIRRKGILKSSVRSSIERLLDLARKSFDAGKAERSTRYVRMAMDLLKKNKVKLPKELRNAFCRKCMSIWVPGRTVTISYDKKRDYLRVRCRCGHTRRL